MRDDIWIERAALLEPFDGKGATAAEVARRTGLSYATVRTYAAKFGFDFAGRASKAPKPSRYEQTRNALREIAAEGATRREAADRLGLKVRTVGSIGRELGIKFKHASEGVGADTSRADVMAAMFKGGKTLQQIGDAYGLSRERVRQVIKKHHGLVGVDGGKAATAEIARQRANAKRDALSLSKHGCLYEQYREIVRIGKEMRAQGSGFYRTPTGAFHSQRQNAISRGIEWNLKLWDWWRIWQTSGKWDVRGRTRGSYVMCRFGDTGAYEVGNVYIATCSHNCSVQPNHPSRQSSVEARAAA